MPMTDFRSRLYARYVSTFKASSALTGHSLASQWKWCDYKILPLLADLPRAAAILELGCGPGYFLDYLRSRGFSNVRGVDISAEQIAIARGKGLPAEEADVFATLNDCGQAFDAIIAIDLLEHFSKAEGLQLADGVLQSLKPGGRIVLQTPNGSALLAGPIIYGDLTHLTIYNQSSLGQLLAIAGFGRIAFAETGPVAKNIRGVLRVGIWRLATVVAAVIRLAECGGWQRIWTQNILCTAFRPDSQEP